MSSSGLHLGPLTLAPSQNQPNTFALRSNSSLRGKAPGTHAPGRCQILCKFRRDEQQQDRATENAFPQSQVLSKTALKKYPKARLEEELRKRDLLVSGNKQDLVDRLHAALTVFLVEEQPPLEAPLTKEDNATTAVSESAYATSESERVSPSVESESSLATLLDLTKRELQQALVERGLSKTGKKTDLAQRLFAVLEEERFVLVTEQMEAVAELQRQYEEAAANSNFRWSGALESTAGEEEEENEEFSKWAEEVEAEEVEYQVPGDDLDNDSIFDNRIATQVAPGILMDGDGRMVESDFSRSSNMMDMFEHQGTAAAELASEDYANHHRAGRIGLSAITRDDMTSLEDSQDIDDDMNPSVTGSRIRRQQQMSPFEEDLNRFDTENELEDGFSFATEDADGFDSDAEERLAQLDSSRMQVVDRQLDTEDTPDDQFSSRHHTSQNLSARAPDDHDDDDLEKDAEAEQALIAAMGSEGGMTTPPAGIDDELDEEGGPLGAGRGAAAVSGAADDGAAAFLGQNSLPFSAGSKAPITGTGKGKGTKLRQNKTALTHAADLEDQASAVVASQGVSSLDNRTALEWMRTRLPEAVQLLDTAATQPTSAIPVQEAPGADTVDQNEQQTEAMQDVDALQPQATPGQVEAVLADAILSEEELNSAEAEPGAALESQEAAAEAAEDAAALETDSPVQFQGFELASEMPPVQPEAAAISESLEEEVQSIPDLQSMESVEEPPEIVQAAGGQADAAAVPDMLEEAVETTDPASESAVSSDTEESGQQTVGIAEHAALMVEEESQPVKAPVSSAAEAHIGATDAISQQEMDFAGLQDEMKQKHKAITALQGKLQVAENAGDDNAARIASLQAALEDLQSQQLAWQRDNLSERLAALLEAASRATLNSSAKEQLKGQLEAMRAELTQLEADLSSRDDEAAKLSRTLADARAKLGGSGGPDAPAPLSHVPGSIRVKLDMDLGQLAGVGPEPPGHQNAKTGSPFPSVKPATWPQTHASSSKSRAAGASKPSFDPGLVMAAGFVGAVKLVSSLFGLSKKSERGSEMRNQQSSREDTSKPELEQGEEAK